MTLKDAYIKVLEGFYGCETGDGRQQMIVQLYNQIQPLPRGYKLKAGDPWCAAYVSACAYVVGVQPEIIKPECGAHEMFQKYMETQRDKGGAEAERGDLVFYDWNSDGRIDHVGVCTERLEDTLQIIEGNFSGKCQIRHIKAADPVIYGIVRPEWETDDRYVYVDCDVLNLRQEPSMDAPISAEMEYGDILTLKSETDGWAFVEWLRNDGKFLEGYCGAGYLSKTVPPVMGETTTAVYLRAYPGVTQRAVAILPAETAFFYSGDRAMVGSSVWERITTDVVDKDEKTGWINTRYCRPIH